MMKYLVLYAMLSSFFLGCAGTNQLPTTPTNPVRIGMVVVSDTSSISNFVILRAAGDTLLGSSQEISLLFVRSDKTASKLPMTMSSMGAPGRSETATMMITCRTNAGALPKYDSVVVEVVNNDQIQRYGVDLDTSRYVTHTLKLRPIDGAEKDTSALQLLTSYAQDGSEYTFTVNALRRREVPGEYFPSSEQLRIRIINGKGAVVWSSSEGLAFLTMIYPVEPSGVGDMHEYSVSWNGMQSDGTPLPAGLYTIEYTLPVKPLPYSTTVKGTFPLE